jgi:hypothetical protein
MELCKNLNEDFGGKLLGFVLPREELKTKVHIAGGRGLGVF